MQGLTGEFYESFLSCVLTKHVGATTNYILQSISYTGIRRVMYKEVVLAIRVINVTSVNPIMSGVHKCV